MDSEQFTFDLSTVATKVVNFIVNVLKTCYFDAQTGEQVVNRFVEAGRGCWYYFNAAGQAVTGKQVINGKQLYFDGSGRQVKGRYVYVGGKRLFCDAKTGVLRQRR